MAQDLTKFVRILTQVSGFWVARPPSSVPLAKSCYSCLGGTAFRRDVALPRPLNSTSELRFGGHSVHQNNELPFTDEAVRGILPQLADALVPKLDACGTLRILAVASQLGEALLEDHESI